MLRRQCHAIDVICLEMFATELLPTLFDIINFSFGDCIQNRQLAWELCEVDRPIKGLYEGSWMRAGDEEVAGDGDAVFPVSNGKLDH